MRTKLIILSVVLSTALLGFRYLAPLFASEFDTFARELIRDVGAPAKRVEVTDALEQYLVDNDIQDPMEYFLRADGFEVHSRCTRPRST